MKHKIIGLVVGCLLALGAMVALPAQPANAHHWDGYSTIYCTAHKPASTVVTHSWPYQLEPGMIGYWCKADFFGTSFQYWVWWNMDTGQHWRPWAYQKCYPAPGYLVVCVGPNHPASI